MGTPSITASDLKNLRTELLEAGVFQHHTARTWGKLLVLWAALAALVAGVILLPWWCALVLVPLAAIPAVSAAMIGHEAGHGSLSASRAHNEVVLHMVFAVFGGLGILHWKNKHNHRHHGNPNVVGEDPDVEIWPMALSSVEHGRSGRFRRWLQRGLQAHLFWPLTLFLGFVMRLESWRHLARRVRARGVERAVLIDAACLLGHYALWLGLPLLWFGVLPVLAFYAGLWATGGLLLALVFAPAHMDLPIVEQGAKGGWLHQLQTTRNLAMPRWLSWLFMGLDYQVEHHLFPRIPHQNLPRAAAVVTGWCARLGVPHQSLAYTRAVAEVTRHMRGAWQAVPVESAG
jgi:fatty acid desaturase